MTGSGWRSRSGWPAFPSTPRATDGAAARRRRGALCGQAPGAGPGRHGRAAAAAADRQARPGQGKGSQGRVESVGTARSGEHREGTQGRHPRGRARHPVPAGDQGAAQGDAAASSTSRRSSTSSRRPSRAGHRRRPHHHRPRQARHRGPLRPQLRARAAARATRATSDKLEQVRRICRPGRRPLRPPGRAARPRPRRRAWPSSTSATSRSPCCSATTSSTRRDRCCSEHDHRAYEQHGGSVVALMEVARSTQITSYGCVDPSRRGRARRCVRITDLVEKPAPEDAPSNLAVIGRYVLHPGDLRRPAGHRARARRRDPAHRRPQHLVHASERGVLRLSLHRAAATTPATSSTTCGPRSSWPPAATTSARSSWPSSAVRGRP